MKSMLGVAAALMAVLSQPSDTTRPGSPARTQVDLSELAWMAGNWGSQERGTTTEEVWLAPAGGLMLGMNRGVSPSGHASFEFLRIEARKDALVYVASPGGKGATDFTLEDVGEKRVVFANPEHDFPQRIHYSLDAEGRLHAGISGTMNGKESALEWTWERQRPAGR